MRIKSSLVGSVALVMALCSACSDGSSSDVASVSAPGPGSSGSAGSAVAGQGGASAGSAGLGPAGSAGSATAGQAGSGPAGHAGQAGGSSAGASGQAAGGSSAGASGQPAGGAAGSGGQAAGGGAGGEGGAAGAGGDAGGVSGAGGAAAGTGGGGSGGFPACCGPDAPCPGGYECVDTLCLLPPPSGTCWSNADCVAPATCQNAAICPCNADCSFDAVAGTCSQSTGIAASLAGIWLMGHTANLNHFSWVRFDDNGQALFLSGEDLSFNVPYWPCSGVGSWGLAQKPDTVAITLPDACQSPLLEVLTFLAAGPIPMYPKGAIASWSVEKEDGSGALEAYKFPPSQCDAAFTACTDPFAQ